MIHGQGELQNTSSKNSTPQIVNNNNSAIKFNQTPNAEPSPAASVKKLSAQQAPHAMQELPDPSLASPAAGHVDLNDSHLTNQSLQNTHVSIDINDTK